MDSILLNQILDALDYLIADNPLPTPEDISKYSSIDIDKINLFFDELDLNELALHTDRMAILQKIRKERFYSKMHRKALDGDKIAMRIMHEYYENTSYDENDKDEDDGYGSEEND